MSTQVDIIFSFHISNQTFFSLKNICNQIDFHASVNMGCQGKSGPGKIHEVILVTLSLSYTEHFAYQLCSTFEWYTTDYRFLTRFTGYVFSISCAFHRSHVFLPFSLSSCLPTLTLATCFPKLSTGFMFSHTLHCLHVFAHLPLATCFPTLVTAGCKFSRATQWLYVSPRSCYNFKFLSLVNGCMFSRAYHWLHIFPPLPMV